MPPPPPSTRAGPSKARDAPSRDKRVVTATPGAHAKQGPTAAAKPKSVKVQRTTTATGAPRAITGQGSAELAASNAGPSSTRRDVPATTSPDTSSESDEEEGLGTREKRRDRPQRKREYPDEAYFVTTTDPAWGLPTRPGWQTANAHKVPATSPPAATALPANGPMSIHEETAAILVESFKELNEKVGHFREMLQDRKYYTHKELEAITMEYLKERGELASTTPVSHDAATYEGPKGSSPATDVDGRGKASAKAKPSQGGSPYSRQTTARTTPGQAAPSSTTKPHPAPAPAPSRKMKPTPAPVTKTAPPPPSTVAPKSAGAMTAKASARPHQGLDVAKPSSSAASQARAPKPSARAQPSAGQSRPQESSPAVHNEVKVTKAAATPKVSARPPQAHGVAQKSAPPVPPQVHPPQAQASAHAQAPASVHPRSNGPSQAAPPHPHPRTTADSRPSTTPVAKAKPAGTAESHTPAGDKAPPTARPEARGTVPIEVKAGASTVVQAHTTTKPDPRPKTVQVGAPTSAEPTPAASSSQAHDVVPSTASHHSPARPKVQETRRHNLTPDDEERRVTSTHSSKPQDKGKARAIPAEDSWDAVGVAPGIPPTESVQPAPFLTRTLTHKGHLPSAGEASRTTPVSTGTLQIDPVRANEEYTHTTTPTGSPRTPKAHRDGDVVHKSSKAEATKRSPRMRRDRAQTPPEDMSTHSVSLKGSDAAKSAREHAGDAVVLDSSPSHTTAAVVDLSDPREKMVRQTSSPIVTTPARKPSTKETREISRPPSVQRANSSPTTATSSTAAPAVRDSRGTPSEKNKPAPGRATPLPKPTSRKPEARAKDVPQRPSTANTPRTNSVRSSTPGGHSAASSPSRKPSPPQSTRPSTADAACASSGAPLKEVPRHHARVSKADTVISNAASIVVPPPPLPNTKKDVSSSAKASQTPTSKGKERAAPLVPRHSSVASSEGVPFPTSEVRHHQTSTRSSRTSASETSSVATPIKLTGAFGSVIYDDEESDCSEDDSLSWVYRSHPGFLTLPAPDPPLSPARASSVLDPQNLAKLDEIIASAPQPPHPTLRSAMKARADTASCALGDSYALVDMMEVQEGVAGPSNGRAVRFNINFRSGSSSASPQVVVTPPRTVKQVSPSPSTTPIADRFTSRPVELTVDQPPRYSTLSPPRAPLPGSEAALAARRSGRERSQSDVTEHRHSQLRHSRSVPFLYRTTPKLKQLKENQKNGLYAQPHASRSAASLGLRSHQPRPAVEQGPRPAEPTMAGKLWRRAKNSLGFGGKKEEDVSVFRSSPAPHQRPYVPPRPVPARPPPEWFPAEKRRPRG